MSYYILAVSHLYIGHSLGKLLWQLLAKHSDSALLYGFWYEFMSIHLRSAHCDEEVSLFDAAGINVYALYLTVCIAMNADSGNIPQKVI